MKIFSQIFINALLLIPYSAFNQESKKYSINNEQDLINKWIKACVNLEVKPNLFTSKRFTEMVRKSISKEGLDRKESMRIQDSAYHTRYTGTGIYFLYKNKHYIITVRHLLEDTSSHFKDDVAEHVSLVQNGSVIGNGKQIDSFPAYLILTMHRPLNEVPIIFSSKDLDLAIISLDDVRIYGKQFVRVLDAYGYVPIGINDIDTISKLRRDDYIIAFGFPQFSEVGRIKIPTGVFGDELIKATIPVVTKGYVEDTSLVSKYFSGNIFIYSGFSGGPVVNRYNKMIGINKAYFAQPNKVEGINLNYYYREKSLFIKSKYIISLIAELEKRLSSK